VRDEKAAQLFPEVRPMSFDEAVARAANHDGFARSSQTSSLRRTTARKAGTADVSTNAVGSGDSSRASPLS